MLGWCVFVHSRNYNNEVNATYYPWCGYVNTMFGGWSPNMRLFIYSTTAVFEKALAAFEIELAKIAQEMGVNPAAQIILNRSSLRSQTRAAFGRAPWSRGERLMTVNDYKLHKKLYGTNLIVGPHLTLSLLLIKWLWFWFYDIYAMRMHIIFGQPFFLDLWRHMGRRVSLCLR